MKFVLVCYSRNRKQTQATSSMKPSLITPGPHPSSLPPSLWSSQSPCSGHGPLTAHPQFYVCLSSPATKLYSIQVQEICFLFVCFYFSFTPHSALKRAGHKTGFSKGVYSMPLVVSKCYPVILGNQRKVHLVMSQIIYSQFWCPNSKSYKCNWRHVHTDLLLITYASFLIIAEETLLNSR